MAVLGDQGSRRGVGWGLGGHLPQSRCRAVQEGFPKKGMPVPSSGEWVNTFLEKGWGVKAFLTEDATFMTAEVN